MSERIRNLAYTAIMVALAVLVIVLVATTPSDADRVERLGNSIRCPVCQGESIADSPSTMARDMMALVEERVAQGWSDQDIVDEMLSAYSGAVLLDPPARGSTLLLWIAPGAALAFGVAVIVWWRRHPGEGPAPSPAIPRSRGRMLAGALILVTVFAGIVVAAGFFLQERAGPEAGVADLAGDDLSQVSNQTMEAVIAANADHPEVAGMRLALAERYFDEGDYRSAFPHYLAVAQSPVATDAQMVSALIRLGWMAWDGNRESQAAIGMFDQALAIDPEASTARYLKGQVLWCGEDRPEEAAALFTEVLAGGDLPAESRETVRADLQAVQSGEPCT